jgi:hypothetical protein
MVVVCLAGCAGGADANASDSMTGTGGAPAGTGGDGATMMAGTGGMPAAGTGGASGGAGMAAPSGPPTFTRVWNEVLDGKTCSGTFCHGMGIGMLHLDNSAIAYQNLVGVPAAGDKCGTSGKMRVVPFDPDNSLLLDKISHEQPSCGDLMPLGAKIEPNCVSNVKAVCNTQAEIQLVHDWIAAGAMND